VATEYTGVGQLQQDHQTHDIAPRVPCSLLPWPLLSRGAVDMGGVTMGARDMDTMDRMGLALPIVHPLSSEKFRNRKWVLLFCTTGTYAVAK
jgi:hypothetical protein